MTQLIDESLNYVVLLLANNLPENCLYHNINHTKRVLKNTKEILENSSINKEESYLVQLAAVFHDAGYINGCKDHEEHSVEIATNFLKDKNLTEPQLEVIKNCILATKMENVPKTELEKILRDADASHFAKPYFEEVSELLRLEFKLQNISASSKRSWLKENIDLLQNVHVFYTDYAKTYWEPLKQENINKMIEEQKKLLPVKEKKEKSPERAIQSVYRITLRNHIKLSAIADYKANILLSVNAIIISITLSTLIPKLDNPSNFYLITPAIIFIFFTVLTIGMSVLATRPNVTSGQFTKKDVENKDVNLLFFGNFHKMKLPDYEWAMQEMLKDKDYIYSSMTKDLYFLGLVLQRKYKILRITYTIFIIGIIISVISFAIAFKLAEIKI